MSPAKILVFAGSIRTGSFNARLAALMVKELTLIDADVTHISLADYPMPIYNGDLEAAVRAARERAQAQAAISWLISGIFIASPEYNASITPLLKNSLDWVSRVREEQRAAARAPTKIACLRSARPRPARLAACAR